MFDIKMEGLDEVQNALKRLQRTAQEMDGETKVPFSEIFPPEFMRKYTKFKNIEAMIDASGHNVQTPEDFAAIPDDEWETLVKTKTKFSSWKEMQIEAAKNWAGTKIERAWEGKR